MLARNRLYFALLGLALALVAAMQLLAPTPVDWSDSFQRDDARPFASAVVFDVLPALFPAATVEPVDGPPYLRLRDGLEARAAYVFVADAFAPDGAEAGRLLGHARSGGTLFVAAADVAGPFADSLRLRVRPRFGVGADSIGAARLHYVSPALGPPAGYPVRGQALKAYVTAFDTSRAAVLALDDREAPVLVRHRVGRGHVVVSTTPRLFTNVHALDARSRPALWAALSQIPADVPRVLWDAHHKPGRIDARTPLRYVLREPALRTAYGLVVAGVLLFLVVRGRRTQRVMPVVTPPENATVGFVETVGRLYYNQGDHADLARKKIRYFLDDVRTHLRLPTSPVDDDLLDRLAERAGVPRATVQQAFDAIAAARGADRLAAADLKRLSDRLEAVYAESPRLRRS